MISKELDLLMNERFGKDSIISLATSLNDIPYVRNVNAFYYDGSFYVITYALSDKMRQINKNNKIAIAGFWFTAHGTGINRGYFNKKENEFIKEKLIVAFKEWIDNGHNNFDDENTIILEIKLTGGKFFKNGTCYEF